jgi:gliding motility-associated-like protein
MSIYTVRKISKKLRLLLALLLSTYVATAQTKWVQPAGGAGFDDGRNLAIDGSGNAYVVGSFTGPAQFGKLTLGAAGPNGKRQAYLAKYDAQGNVLWAQEATATTAVFADVAVDKDGNAYVLGGFSGSITMGSTTLTSAATGDMVVAKYTPQGNLLWARAGGTAPTSSFGGSSLALDAAGNVYITGSLSGSATLGGSLGTSTSVGKTNMFVAKYSSQGDPLWLRQGGGDKGNGSFGVALGLDALGNIYVAGSFNTVAVFGSTTLLTLNPDTQNSIFLVKCDSNGNFLWARAEGGPSTTSVADVAVDSQGNSFIVGMLGGNPARTATFGKYTLQVSAFDGYLVKHDTDGNVLWANQIGGSSTEYSTGVAVDKFGNGYVTGIFGSPVVYLGPSTSLVSANEKLVYAIKYDPQGKVLAAQREALCGGAINPAIAVGPAQDIYLTGYFSGQTSFASTLLKGNANDVFVTRLGDLSTPSTPSNFSCTSAPAPVVPVPTPAPPPVAAAEVQVPNILTPNGDGLNDKLKIKGLVDKSWSLSIYGRWGKEVYATSSYQQDWDPTGVPAGMYYYMLRHPTGLQYKGWIEIVY